MFRQSMSVDFSDASSFAEFTRKRKTLLISTSLIRPIAEQAVTKLRDKFDFKFFSINVDHKFYEEQFFKVCLFQAFVF